MQHDAHVLDYLVELTMRQYPITFAYLAALTQDNGGER